MSKVVEVGTLGLVDDAFGEQAAADAARAAGQIGADAASEAEAGINRRFDVTQQNIQPQIDAGNLARNQQLDILGLNGTAAQQQFFDQQMESPAQQFIRNRAQKNLLQNSAAIGGIGGGDVRTALVEQGAGFASQDIDNQFNRLGTLAGGGNAATANLGNLSATAGGQAANAITAGGQAVAAGELGAAQANANAINQFTGLAGAGIGFLAGGPAGASVGSQASQFLTPQTSNVNIGFL